MQSGFKIEKGKISHPKIEDKVFENLQHGDLKSVNAIILHRTDSSTATSTLNAYRGQYGFQAHS